MADETCHNTPSCASGKEQSSIMPSLLPNKKPVYEIFKTSTLVALWIAMGIYNSIVQPSVDALKDILSCNYEQLARVLVSKNIGMIVGSVILAFFTDKFKRRVDIFLTIEAIFMALGNALVPWCNTLLSMSAAFFVAGFAQGGISAAGNSHCMALWGSKASVPLHVVHFGFGLGSAIGPFLLLPFLNGTSENNTQHLSVNADVNKFIPVSFDSYREEKLLQHNSSANTTVDGTVIQIPFAVAGGFGLLIAVLLAVFICLPWPEELHRRSFQTERGERQGSFLQHFSIQACFQGESALYGISTLSLLILFYVGLVGQACALGVYLYAIAVDTSLNFSAQQGAYLMIAYNSVYAAGRAVAIFIAVCLRVQILLFLEMGGILIGSIFLCVYGMSSQTALWIIAPTINFFAGPLYPTGMAWADKYAAMTALAVSLLDIAIGLGAFLATWLTGYVFQYYTTQAVFYFSLGWAVLCASALVTMQIIGSAHGERHRETAQQVDGGPGEDGARHTNDNGIEDPADITNDINNISDSQPLIQ